MNLRDCTLAKQQVVIQLLEQLPLRVDPVERLQQRGQEELLSWSRWASSCGVQLAEAGIESSRL